MEEQTPGKQCSHNKLTFTKFPRRPFTCATDNLEKYRCANCHISSDLVVHFHGHNVKGYTCHKCDNFDTYSSLVLAAHEERCQITVPRDYKCGHCNVQTETLHALKLHILNYHTAPEDVTRLECPCCGRRIKLAPKDNLLADIESFDCDYCEQSLKGATWLCAKCPYKTLSRHVLLEHVGAQHRGRSNGAPSSAKWPRCEYCPYRSKHNISYRSRHIWDKHIEHDASEYFRCDLCQYKSVYKDSVKRHRSAQHRAASAVKMDDCIFGTNNQLDVLKEEVVDAAVESIQWFECEQCHFTVKSRELLGNHIKVKHAAFKDCIKCAFCLYIAKKAATMKEHVRSVHATMDYTWDHNYSMKIVM